MEAAAQEELRMTSKSNTIEISVICLVFILISLGGIVWDVTSGLLTSGIDGIMLLFVALMVVLIFGLMWLYELQQAGFLPQRKKEPAKTSAPAAKPAASSASVAAKATPAQTSAPPKPVPAPGPAPEK